MQFAYKNQQHKEISNQKIEYELKKITKLE